MRGLDILGLRHFRHVELVLEARFALLEGGGEHQDRLAVLDRGDAAHAEAVAVARAVDVACPNTWPPNTYLVPMSRLWPRNRLSSSRSSVSSATSSETTCEGSDGELGSDMQQL